MSNPDSVYVIVHDCGLNGAAIEPAKAYPTEEAAEEALAALFATPRNELAGDARDIRQTTGYGGAEVVELELAFPEVGTYLLIELANVVSELGHLSHVLSLGLGVTEAPEAAPAAEEAPERLPWAYWAPELRTRLKQLAGRFPAQAVADCAAELAKLIAEHGPRTEEYLETIERAEARRR